MKKKRTGLMVVFIILGVLVVAIGGFASFLMIGQNVKDATIQSIDVSKIADGTYDGSYSGGRFGNQLEVTVLSGKITDIKIVRDMVVPAKDVSSKLFAEVEQDQKLDVDAVSGATVSSKAYLMAVENALSGK